MTAEQTTKYIQQLQCRKQCINSQSIPLPRQTQPPPKTENKMFTKIKNERAEIKLWMRTVYQQQAWIKQTRGQLTMVRMKSKHMILGSRTTNVAQHGKLTTPGNRESGTSQNGCLCEGSNCTGSLSATAISVTWQTRHCQNPQSGTAAARMAG